MAISITPAPTGEAVDSFAYQQWMLTLGQLLSGTTFDEATQDAVGSILVDSATIDFTYTDATPSITADVKSNSISNTLLSDMGDSTIKGRAVGAGTGDPTDLTAAQLVTIINTADGVGSLLDSDFLDGQSGAYYLDSANFTGTNWTDLTDAGATTLHKHDHGGQDGLTDDDHGHYWNYARGAARIALRI